MTNEHQSVEQLFEVALALPPEQRRGFVDRECSGAPMLRHVLEQLIEAEGLPDSFLRTPVFAAKNGQSSTPNTPLPPTFDIPPRFGIGEVIAGRFQVVRFIARGGMGEVYEVEDRLLQGTPIALKIIRPTIAADPYTSRRFQQEVLLARRVNHRNLCPIYEIYHCEEPLPPFLYLTMKLLAGESLESRLKREGIPLDEGIKICGQLMEGIGAIHNVGIIHRDIKPNNVMLERSGPETCVTIMDFGLARLSEADPTLSRIGMVAGTLGYLAPELIRGASPSPASDLYALGVVLHQVLTGVRPTLSRDGRTVAVAPELRMLKAPAALAQTVTEFLSEDPERRCAAFERIVHHQGTRVEEARPPLLTRRSFAISGAAALGCVGAGSILKWREIDDLLHPLPKKRFVALLNWPPPSDAKVTPMVLGLIDAMVNALSRAEAFDHDFYVACQNRLTEMKTPAQVAHVCESLGTNLILATSGSMMPDGITIVLRVLSTGSAQVLRSRTLHVSTGEQLTLPGLVTQAAAQILDLPPTASGGASNQLGTDNPDALAAYQAAEASMKEPNNGGLNAAIEKYKLAVEIDPHFANAHARLAAAFVRVHAEHYDPTSIELARANSQTAINLDPDCSEAHAALAMIHKEFGEFPQALKEISLALAPDPGSSRMIIYQAQIYFASNRWQEAEEALKRVLRARPNYWLAYHELGNTYLYQGKYRPALQAFQAASVTSPRSAQPVANTALVFFLLGDFNQAEGAIERSVLLEPLSYAFEIRSDVLRARNKFSESLQAATKASEISPEDSTPWLRMADAYESMKHHSKQANENYMHALAAVTEVLKADPGDRPSWILMALYQAKTGDRVSAASSIRKAEDSTPLDVFSMMYKVRVLELLGRRNDALSAMETCLRMGVTSTQIQTTNDLERLTSDPHYLGLLQSARATV